MASLTPRAIGFITRQSRSTPISYCLHCCSRNQISTSATRYAARGAPRPSPRTRNKPAGSKLIISTAKGEPVVFDIETAIPSLNFLKSAKENGKLNDIEPEDARNLLLQYGEVKSMLPSAQWSRQLAENFSVPASVFFQLSSILASFPTIHPQALSRMLLRTAFNLNHPDAALQLAHIAIRSPSYSSSSLRPEHVEPLTKLRLLARQGEPSALVMQAQLLARDGQLVQAWEMLLRVLDPTTNSVERLSSSRYVDEIIKTTVLLARLLRRCHPTTMSLEDAPGITAREAARGLMELIASEFDDANAHLELARLSDSPAAVERHLQMAAAAGLADAANELSEFYSGRAEVPRGKERAAMRAAGDERFNDGPERDAVLAQDWKDVAITGGINARS